MNCLYCCQFWPVIVVPGGIESPTDMLVAPSSAGAGSAGAEVVEGAAWDADAVGGIAEAAADVADVAAGVADRFDWSSDCAIPEFSNKPRTRHKPQQLTRLIIRKNSLTKRLVTAFERGLAHKPTNIPHNDPEGTFVQALVADHAAIRNCELP